MQYMLLIYRDEAVAPVPGTDAWITELQAWGAYTQALRDAGVHVAGDPLQPIETATTVRAPDGETLFVDGPFAATKEHLAGYYVIDVPDLDRALGWAARCPIVTHGGCEVRPLMAIADEAAAGAPAGATP